MKKILIVAGIVLAAAGFFFWRYSMRPAEPARNVIFITIDTLRADHLGSYGYAAAQTPHMDDWARRGVLFQNATATTPLTLPSHSSIMTGNYPLDHGVRDNGGFYLDEKWQTLAETLKGNGINTGGFVSAFVLDRRWGISQGFDYYFDNFELSKFKSVSLDSVQRRGDETLQQAIQWIDSKKNERFFAWIHFYDPHTPYDPPDPYRSGYENRPFGLYDGEIAYTDHLIGQLNEFLKKNGLFDNTAIVLTSDHGESLGEHNESGHGFFIYDSTTHVPLIILAPGIEPRKVKEQVRSVDLYPTICSLMQVNASQKIEGVSLAPFLLGKSLPEPLSAYSESYYPKFHYGWSELKSVRTTEYKYIDAPRRELYRISQDTDESDNLYNSDRKKADPFEKQIAYLVQNASPELTGPRAMDDESLEKLQALGYIGTYVAPAATAAGETLPDPKDKIGLYNKIKLAQWKSAENKTEESLTDMLEVLRQDPRILEAHLITGNLYMKKSDFARARQNFQNALDLDPDFVGAIFGLAFAYEREMNYEGARAGFERLIQIDPKDPKPYFHLGEIAAAEKKFEEALPYFSKTVELEPEQAAFRNRLGACYLELKQYDRARKEVSQAMQMNERLPNAHFTMALILEELQEWNPAIDAYRKELELYPESYPARFNLSRIFRKLGDRSEEKKELELCIDQEPDYGVAYLYLAKNVMDGGGDLSKAKELTIKGLEKSKEKENLVFGNFLMTDLLNRMGQAREADIYLRRARELQSTI
jgi:arylsulfatase A-like enzyme/Tfp pilus assembly protein PilF